MISEEQYLKEQGEREEYVAKYEATLERARTFVADDLALCLEQLACSIELVEDEMTRLEGSQWVDDDLRAVYDGLAEYLEEKPYHEAG